MFVVLLLSACSLDENPYDFIEADDFYKSTEDSYAALVVAYDILGKNAYYGRSLFFLANLTTEELTLKTGVSSNDAELDNLDIKSTNSHLENFYSIAYVAINRTNAVIDRTLVRDNLTVTDSVIVGEAYALRALHYFNLVRVFGPVVLNEREVVNYNTPTQLRTNLSGVYDLIIEDLQKSEELLAIREGNEYMRRSGRFDIGSVKSLLAKVYCTLGSAHYYAVPGYNFAGSIDYYALAKEKAAEVIADESLYGYALIPDYGELWDVEKKNSAEHILSVQFEESNEEGSTLSTLLTIMGDGAVLDDGTQLGKGWGHAMVEMPFYDSFSELDSRKEACFITSLTSSWYGKKSVAAGTMSPWVKKYIDGNKNGYNGSCNFPIIRYSDVLLIYAEAATQLGTSDRLPTYRGNSAFVRVRSRSVPGYSLGELLSEREFRDKIIEERAFELCFEANRWFDYVRSDHLLKVLRDKYGKDVSSDDYFVPLPLRAIDLNKRLLEEPIERVVN